eukprot:751310-Hanusia_phi.AAC.2
MPAPSRRSSRLSAALPVEPAELTAAAGKEKGHSCSEGQPVRVRALRQLQEDVPARERESVQAYVRGGECSNGVGEKPVLLVFDEPCDRRHAQVCRDLQWGLSFTWLKQDR